jgi:hypothetical protein
MAYGRNLDSFDNYREIAARFNSVGTCGHEIKVSDRIGYNGRLKRTQCAGCWAKWCGDNEDAAMYEMSLPAGFGCE